MSTIILILGRKFQTLHGSRLFHAARFIRKDNEQGFMNDQIDLRYYSCSCDGCIKGGECLHHGEWERKHLIPL